ncbi:MAG: tetratricopeptide repeat protein [Candidatus Methylomirabilis oxygeniifera]|nr:MAG: tetratricopeptide repeat protein [Candidatus Methylomirabilis oxyfera]
MSFRSHPVAVCLAIVGLAGLLYAGSLLNGFAFDDHLLVETNLQFRSIEGLTQLFRSGGWLTYRPIRTASYAIDYALFGLNPSGFRAFNILYHALNGVLVFTVLRTILGVTRPAFLTALLFIVHPVQTESVAYISGRRDILFTLFYLTGFYGFVRYRATGRGRWLYLTGISYYLGLLSKEMAITLPLLCLAYDLVRSMPEGGEGDRRSWRALREAGLRLWRDHRRLYLVIGAIFSATAYYFVALFRVTQRFDLWGDGLWPTVLTSVTIMGHYLTLLLWPVTLNVDYSFNAFPVPETLLDGRVLMAIAAVGGSWWAIWRGLANHRWAAFGGLWFFTTLLPVAQIIPHDEIVAEHYLYLPSIGVCLAAAMLAEGLPERIRQRRAVTAVFGLVVVLLGFRTVIRTRDWKDDLTLWTRTVETAPASARARRNLGRLYMIRGRHQEAAQEFREALRIAPNDAPTWNNLGAMLLELGNLDGAEQAFTGALRLNTLPLDVRINLGIVSLRRGRTAQAEAYFLAALASSQLPPSQRAQALNNLGMVRATQGRSAEAEQAFKEAVALAPGDADARRNLGLAYLEKGQMQAGIAELEEAVRYKAADPTLHHLLGEVYHMQGQQDRAVASLRKALSLKGDLAEARELLDSILRSSPTTP